MKKLISTYLIENNAFLSTHIAETLKNADLETFLTHNDAAEFILFDLLADFSRVLLTDYHAAAATLIESYLNR